MLNSLEYIPHGQTPWESESYKIPYMLSMQGRISYRQSLIYSFIYFTYHNIYSFKVYNDFAKWCNLTVMSYNIFIPSHTHLVPVPESRVGIH